jgi:hypothetical protein
MEPIWHAIVSHWSVWTISGAFGFVGGLIASAFRWRWPSWKEWTAERKTKRDKDIDLMIMVHLDSLKPNTGSVTERIAEALSLDRDVVIESLDRLETKERIRNGGRTVDGSHTVWYSLHR